MAPPWLVTGADRPTLTTPLLTNFVETDYNDCSGQDSRLEK